MLAVWCITAQPVAAYKCHQTGSFPWGCNHSWSQAWSQEPAMLLETHQQDMNLNISQHNLIYQHILYDTCRQLLCYFQPPTWKQTPTQRLKFERGRTGVPPYSEMHGVLPSGLVDRDNKTRLTWTDLRTSPVFAKNLWSVLVNSLTVAWKPWVPTSTSQSLDPVSSIELQEWEGQRQGVHAQRTLVSHHYLARKIWTPPWYSDESNSNSARLDCWCQKRSTNTKIWLNMWWHELCT